MKYLLPTKVHSLGLISFLTGFALMTYELVAARLLAPTIGSSIYVWTSVIGIIIASLSIGYWLGGKLADSRKRPIDVVALCLLAAVCVVFTIIAHTPFLAWIASSIEDTRLQGVIASLVLFAPTSLVLGLIGPYLAKLNIRALDTAGESVANLSALNSIGGIIGTFVTGFILFGYIGSNETLFIVVVCLIASSWLLVPKRFIWQRSVLSALLLLIAIVPAEMPTTMLARIDSPSAHYEISRMVTNQSSTITALATGPGGIQSAVYTDNRDELVFWYTNYAAQLIEASKPDKVLILGGGAFTLPNYLSNRIPDATIDVVEIDPVLEDISKKYFNYQQSDSVNLVFDDARAFVNTSKNTYDIIFVDVYGDSYVPFSLLTKQYAEKINSLLSPNGAIIMNAIVGLDGECKELLGAIEGTYRPYFPYGFWETQSGKAMDRGNYILVYSRQNISPLPMKTLADTSAVAYSDNFMPAERLHYQCAQASS